MMAAVIWHEDDGNVGFEGKLHKAEFQAHGHKNHLNFISILCNKKIWTYLIQKGNIETHLLFDF